jgi:hypothetical protein
MVRSGGDFKGFTPDPNPEGLLRKNGLASTFVAVYMGMTHCLGTILEVAKQMCGNCSAVIVVDNVRAESPALKWRSREQGLE